MIVPLSLDEATLFLGPRDQPNATWYNGNKESSGDGLCACDEVFLSCVGLLLNCDCSVDSKIMLPEWDRFSCGGDYQVFGIR